MCSEKILYRKNYVCSVDDIAEFRTAGLFFSVFGREKEMEEMSGAIPVIATLLFATGYRRMGAGCA